jgi:hypothetical protein
MNASSFVAALLLMAFFCQSDALVLRRPRWRDEGKGNDDGPDNGISIDGKSNADDDVSDAINILRKIVNDKEFRVCVKTLSD